MTKLESLLEDFSSAIDRLDEVLKREKDEVIRDSAIQRFEFTFELAWKSLKAFLEEYHNVTCTSPRSCFKEAFRQKIFEYSDFWIEITKLRNQIVHTYKKEIAENIYANLPKVLKHFKILLSVIREKLKE